MLSAPRIAVDLLGGAAGLAVVVDGVVAAADRWPELQLLLVGPPEQTRAALASRGIASAEAAGLRIVPAAVGIGAGEDPVRAVRSRRDATVRVAARLLRDGEADASVSFGPADAAVAAALFTLGRVPGLARPPLAATVPAPDGPVVLLDTGATTTASADLLVQFALAGAAYATTRLGIAHPGVGLLSTGYEPGSGDPLRREAAERLAQVLPALGVTFVGNVAGDALTVGGNADVVVTDGFTGSVLLKALEGLATAGHGGAEASVLLGVDAVVAVAEGASSPDAVASCIRTAAGAVTDGLLSRLTDSMAALVDYRRAGEPLSQQVPA